MSIDFREIQLQRRTKAARRRTCRANGQTLEEIVDERFLIGFCIADNGEADMVADSYIEDPTEWAAYFEAWLKRQRSRNPNVDDSRESIYPDRG